MLWSLGVVSPVSTYWLLISTGPMTIIIVVLIVQDNLLHQFSFCDIYLYFEYITIPINNLLQLLWTFYLIYDIIPYFWGRLSRLSISLSLYLYLSL